MATIGYFLSSEEYPGSALVDAAARAEQAGFPTAWISDHFHPWLDEQGQSPFVWAVIGGALGPDPAQHIAAIQEYVEAGFEEGYVAQIGPDQEGMIDSYRREVLPQLA